MSNLDQQYDKFLKFCAGRKKGGADQTVTPAANPVSKPQKSKVQQLALPKKRPQKKVPPPSPAPTPVPQQEDPDLDEWLAIAAKNKGRPLVAREHTLPRPAHKPVPKEVLPASIFTVK